MPTYQHSTRKPIHREHTTTVVPSCFNCGLTRAQVSYLRDPVCCHPQFSPASDFELRSPELEPLEPSNKRTVETAIARSSHFIESNTPARPQVARTAEQLPKPRPPYSTIVITKCDDCGGDGRDHGQQDDYYPCNYCGGSGEQAVLRNWFGEAFQIESGVLTTVDVQREHLTALRHYATQALNAYMTEKVKEVA